MKKIWLLLADRFDALQPRERVTVFVGLVAMLLGAFWALALDPATLRHAQARKALQQSESLMAILREQELALTQHNSLSPDAQINQQLSALRAENTALRERMTTLDMPLVSPDKMRSVLQDLIAAQQGLSLAAIRSLPPQDLLSDASLAQSAALASGQSLYRQGIEITVQGDYRALAEYLRKVEALPWKVQVEGVSLRTASWPQSSMKLLLYTLSLEKSWIAF